MLTKVSLGAILVIAAVNCRFLTYEYKTFQKNGLTFEVNGGEFEIKWANIPVLRRKSIADIEEMEKLWLRYNNISTIKPGAFENLPYLFNLYITNNNLQRIEVGVFNNLNLISLTLSDNGIEFIASHAFDNMTRLESIFLFSNKLKEWDSQWFANTPSLVSFFLDRNLFTRLPADAFGKKKRSRDCQLVALGRNPINQIEDNAFRSFEYVTELEISINSTDALNGNFLRATHFGRVDITIDNIECLDKKYFGKIFVADKTVLHGDTFDKNCKNKIARWATAHQKTVTVSNY